MSYLVLYILSVHASYSFLSFRKGDWLHPPCPHHASAGLPPSTTSVFSYCLAVWFVGVCCVLHTQVTHVPAYSPYAVAEHATALILALNRKIYRVCGLPIHT